MNPCFAAFSPRDFRLVSSLSPRVNHNLSKRDKEKKKGGDKASDLTGLQGFKAAGKEKASHRAWRTAAVQEIAAVRVIILERFCMIICRDQGVACVRGRGQMAD